MSLRVQLRGARAAFTHLSRLPVGGFPYTDEEWKASPGWYPLVGLVVGMASAGTWELTRPLGRLPAVVLTLIVSALLTGAMHEDGLADSADALGGAVDRETIFEILKDSRLGTYGVLTLLLATLLKLSLLHGLGARTSLALVLTHVLARTPPVWLLRALPYVTPFKGKSGHIERPGPGQPVLATLLALLAILVAIVHFGMDPFRVVPLAMALAFTTLLTGWRYHARAGGVTGDFLGATEQVGECLLLLAFTVPAYHL